MRKPAVTTFRALHASGCFVMPNPWDVGSAKFLASLGFKALASTSAGFAFSRGLPDTTTAVPCATMIAHVRELAEATTLPVNADFQSGYADDPEGVAANVTACVATGVAGLSIEDATPHGGIYDRQTALARLRAARAAIDASRTGVLLTARCETYLVGDPEPAVTAVERLSAYADAGADCLFAPDVRDPAVIAELVRAVAPRPLNVLVSSPGLTVRQLADLGVRRISVGSALARAAWGAFMHAARHLAEEGSILAGAATFGELNALFAIR